MVKDKDNLNPNQPSTENTLAAKIAKIGSSQRERVIRQLAGSFSALDRSDLEDCYQQAWETTLLKQPSEDEQELAGFISLVSRRRALDLYRSRNLISLESEYVDRLEYEQSELVPQPQELLAGKEQAAVLQDLLARLKPRVRLIAHLRWIEGLSPEEIRERQKLNTKQYEGLITRAKRTLSKELIRLESGHFCSEHADDILAAVVGELSVESEKLLKLHLDHCAGCRKVYRQTTTRFRSASAFLPMPLLMAGKLTSALNSLDRFREWLFDLFTRTQGSQELNAAAKTTGVGGSLALGKLFGVGAVAVIGVGSGVYVAQNQNSDADSAPATTSISATTTTPQRVKATNQSRQSTKKKSAGSRKKHKRKSKKTKTSDASTQQSNQSTTPVLTNQTPAPAPAQPSDSNSSITPAPAPAGGSPGDLSP